MLGLDHELGSIEPGKKADLIATSASPLDDISELTRVQFVMRDGIVFKTE
jgi:imidazolonepropionase-like amidohydrolase